MTEEEIRILSSMAAENRRGMLFLQEGGDEALLYLPRGAEIMGRVPRAVAEGLIDRGWVDVGEDSAGRLSDGGLEAVRSVLLPRLSDAWEQRMVGGISGTAFLPVHLGRRDTASANTDAFVALGWIALDDGVQPLRFTEAARDALGIRQQTPEEIAEAHREARARRERATMEERERTERAEGIRLAGAKVIAKARAVLHGDGQSGELDVLKEAVTALEALEAADRLAKAPTAGDAPVDEIPASSR